uniref:rRNA methyltransferase 2, mitochondrial n=1 Tax=Hanusia phi TaxID=3032 RepID=A0A7S0E2E1_9CRYP|mmetsp:Transcript_15422/g.35338  ORF Transcript_15422/g.35338 Transcript_15422/m.35338 type:complete len:106 (+) Transcript_15422:2-319(+)
MEEWLKRGGKAVVKVFRGEGYDECLNEMRARFNEVKVRKPEASRGRSTEIFLVGVGFKGAVDVQMGQERAEEEEEDRTVLVAEEKPKTKKKKKLDDLMDGMYGDM